MIRKTHKNPRTIAAFALAGLLAAWGAQPALSFDGRSPDTRDAAMRAAGSSVVDARSPDTREASQRASVKLQTGVIDVRSPDTREASQRASVDLRIGIIDLRSPDTREASQRASVDLRIGIIDLRSPDTREAADGTKMPIVADLRSPDTREAADRRKPYAHVSIVDARSPDTRDAALRALQTGVVAPALVSADRVSGDRFHWDDFGIGVGVAVGSMLLFAGLAAGTLAGRQRRGETTGAATT